MENAKEWLRKFFLWTRSGGGGWYALALIGLVIGILWKLGKLRK